MPLAVLTTFLALLLVPLAQGQTVSVHMATSDAIDFARLIAHDEGNDVTKTRIYSFDLIEGEDGKPLVQGYVTIGFDINGSHRNLIAISESTAQAIDVNTCEVFDYPDLKPFQDWIIRLSEAHKRTPQELATDVGCSNPAVLTTPVPVAKHR
jgi:hypothetical protein